MLPDEIINQIAAGEVVERPSHLVKELCENALDAEATQIEVQVGKGGRAIQVKDNGLGISPSDLPLAILRHSTSKIKNLSDIWNLRTYGFRGEALASIASISDFSICSRQADQEFGARIQSKFGKVTNVVTVGAEYGTIVVVDDLFENVPARLKFLKSPNVEISQIRNVIKALALANPKVQWRLIIENKLDQFFASATPSERASQVFGNYPVFYGQASLSDYNTEVWFLDPHETAKTNKNIWMFVQGRWVQDRALMAAVMEGYRNLLMHHEYPQIVVSIHADPKAVDVNIHPTKSQVKFENPSDAFRSVVHAIRSGLEKAEWRTNTLAKNPILDMETPYQVTEPQQLHVSSPEFTQTYYRSKLSPLNNKHVAAANEILPSVAELKALGVNRDHHIQTFESNRNKKSGESNILSAKDQLSYWQHLQVIGQVGLTYIICQNSDELIIIDQHAADERVRFEKIKRQIESQKFLWQDLLFPIVIDMTPEKKEAIMKLAEKLLQLGVKVEEIGSSSISISSHADWVTDKKLPELLIKMADQYLEMGESYSMEQYQSEWIASQACHGAIRAGKALSLLEIQMLLKEMDNYPLSSFCPHGRPVSVKKSFLDLDKEFGRIVT
jgi:DNA mismatch repair protein MutL